MSEPIGLLATTMPEWICAECNGRSTMGILAHKSGCPQQKRLIATAVLVPLNEVARAQTDVGRSAFSVLRRSSEDKA